MKTLVRTAALAAALACLAGPAPAQSPPAPPPHPASATLTVSGQGTVMAEPDIAIVTLGVVSRGATAREALTANSTDMEAVIGAIRQAGVADRDIGTSGFYVNPVYQPGEPQPDGSQAASTIIGYEVTNQVTVTVRDIAGSGALLDAVIGAGANRVTGISFDIDDPASLEDQAAAAAVAAARHKAEVLAAAAEVSLARIVSITTDAPPQPMYDMRMMAAASPAVPIMRGAQAVTATATIVWEIAAP